MKKDGEEILQDTTLGMERLHRRVTGSDIEGGGNNKEKQQKTKKTKNNNEYEYIVVYDNIVFYLQEHTGPYLMFWRWRECCYIPQWHSACLPSPLGVPISR